MPVLNRGVKKEEYNTSVLKFTFLNRQETEMTKKRPVPSLPTTAYTVNNKSGEHTLKKKAGRQDERPFYTHSATVLVCKCSKSNSYSHRIVEF